MSEERVEYITEPKPAENIDALDRPVSEIMFKASQSQIDERLKKIEAFIKTQKGQESANLLDTALNIPRDVKIGKKTYKLYGLPAGYRRLMVEKLQSIAKLAPAGKTTPSQQELLTLLQNETGRPVEDLAKELSSVLRQPGFLSKLAPQIPEVFQLMLEVLQLAFHVPKGQPEFDAKGKLLNPVISIEELEWQCQDIEGIFAQIIEMTLPIFFTIQTIQRSLAI